jgi:hypothetical protein
MQVDLREALKYVPEDAAILQALELVGEEEFVEEDVTDIAGKLGDVINEVLMQLGGVLAFELGEREGGKVVDLHVTAGGIEQDHVTGGVVHAVRKGLRRCQHGVLGSLEDAIEAAQHNKRQDHLAVFRLLEVAAQNFRYRPDERTEILNLRCIMRHCPLLLSEILSGRLPRQARFC